MGKARKAPVQKQIILFFNTNAKHTLHKNGRSREGETKKKRDRKREEITTQKTIFRFKLKQPPAPLPASLFSSFVHHFFSFQRPIPFLSSFVYFIGHLSKMNTVERQTLVAVLGALQSTLGLSRRLLGLFLSVNASVRHISCTHQAQLTQTKKLSSKHKIPPRLDFSQSKVVAFLHSRKEHSHSVARSCRLEISNRRPSQRRE